MVNSCTIVITKGNNKNKLCKDVNRWCKHKKVHCNHCDRTFSYQHTYNAHVCLPPYRRSYQPPPEAPCERSSITIAPPMKVKVKIKPLPASIPVRVDETRELKEMVHQLRGEIDEMRKQPKVQINNLTVITDDIFGKIVGQMGEQEGVKFLLDSLDDDAECLNIVEKVYLSGKDKNQYPIACKNENHFRFLGPDHDVVDDVGGDLIVSKITNSVQNAFLKASAETLYNAYDMRSVYDRIKQIPTADQREKLRVGLATKVSNPTHPFFQLEE